MCPAIVPCVCPAMSDPVRGTAARIFAGGPPGQDKLVIEDAVTGDAYRYLNPGWQRIGGSARTYALRTNVYRLAGDARPEIAIDDADNWQRFDAAVVGSDIFTSISNLYMVKPAAAVLPPCCIAGTGPCLRSSTRWRSARRAYAGNDSGVYKRAGSATYKYNNATTSWSQIGSEAATELYPAANTLFIRVGDGVYEISQYTFPVGQSRNRTRQDHGHDDRRVRNRRREHRAPRCRQRADHGPRRRDARDIAAGGAHLFALTTGGRRPSSGGQRGMDGHLVQRRIIHHDMRELRVRTDPVQDRSILRRRRPADAEPARQPEA